MTISYHASFCRSDATARREAKGGRRLEPKNYDSLNLQLFLSCFFNFMIWKFNDILIVLPKHYVFFLSDYKWEFFWTLLLLFFFFFCTFNEDDYGKQGEHETTHIINCTCTVTNYKHRENLTSLSHYVKRYSDILTSHRH